MPENTPKSSLPERFFTRQPIFDRKYRTWGYQLLVRSQDNLVSASTDSDMTLAAEVMAEADTFFGGNSMVSINFAERSILEEMPYALPPEKTVISIPRGTTLAPGTIEALEEFKEDGFTVAMAPDALQDASAKGLDLADIVILSPKASDKDDVLRLAKELGEQGRELLATGVNSLQDLALARSLGFTLFQGHFFEQPQTLSSRSLTSHEASRFKLLQAIEEKDPDFDSLASVIQNDAAISYRLLYYLNTPAFGFTDKINSIKQAVLLLGWKQLRNWLRVLVLTDITPDPKTRQLLVLSVQRGKFFELVSQSQTQVQDDPNELFLLGLFSLLEPMMKMPMCEIIEHLPLSPLLGKALCERDNNRFSAWLRLAQTYECADWAGLDVLISELDLHPLTVSVAYYKSLMWVDTFFQS